MNHTFVYEQLIASACLRTRPLGYVERHHILPRSLGGDNAKSNLVFLTAREHFLAHMLLAKIYGGDLWLPVVRMKTFKDMTKANARLYEIAKIANAKEIGNRLRGTKLTEEHKKKIGASGKGAKRTEETKKNISEALKNKPKSEAHRLALSKAGSGVKKTGISPLAGRKQSPEHIARRLLASSISVAKRTKNA